MAGDWVKMRSNLDTHPKVVAIACDLETSELHVVGMLWKVWTWADQHSLDGNAICVTESFLNRITGNANFSTALRNVGWLDGNDGELTFPRFSEHNGKTAKSRSETALRVNKHRSEVKQKCNAPTVTNALPEKRREEKKEELKTHASGDNLTGMYLRTPLFEEFIRVYPRASAPEAAWVEWQGKVYTEAMRHGKPDVEIEEMIVRAAQEFRDSPAGKPPDGSQDYRPAAAKWLQGNCWEEPRELWQQPNGKVATKNRQPAKPTIKPIPKDARSPNQIIGDALMEAMK